MDFRSILAGARLTESEARFLWDHPELHSALMSAAHEKRKLVNPGNRVGYTVYRIINYTNCCSIGCSFCSFYRPENSPEAFILTLEQIKEKALEAKKMGADQIFLQGGVHPNLPLSYYTDVLRLLTKELGMTVRGFSPVELVYMSKLFQMPLRELLRELKKAGLSSVPGAGAEILTPRMRKILSPRKLSPAEWKETLRCCHEEGLPGSANIVIGSVENTDDIIEHLSLVRNLQDGTGGLKSFVAWTFQPQTTHFPIRRVSVEEYLALIALSRLFLDNIPHIEVSVLGMGEAVAKRGLYAGADDINSIVIEENVLKSQGFSSIEQAETFIRNAGFIPYRRTLNFD
ncbi:MAG: CofH family radical SAM protein [Fibrobacter sp.]|jgi:cyclic dehypoxanthinyl futalosine synthase|nr:CofH family radical SAM protein [Fibrobacter sp.]